MRFAPAATLAALVVLVTTVAGACTSDGGRTRPAASTTSTTFSPGCRVDTRFEAGNGHTSGATYSLDPPSGGDHDPIPAGPGVYSLGTTPADGHLVHSLEHGFVVVWYRPTLPSDAVARVQAIGARFPADVLVVPRPSLPVPAAATVWHRRLLCDGADDDALTRFVTAYRNRAPERH